MKAPESAEQIANNEDLLTEILLYLPAKSLIKFKVVSKQWMSLISSTGFCLSHACSPRNKGSLKPSALFLDVYHFPPSEFSFLPLTHDCVRLPRLDFIDEPIVMILESCSGLLLCASYDSVPDQSTIRCVVWYPTTGKVKMFPFPSSPRYFICNPTTRKFKMLSFPSSQVEDYEHEALNLAFDPLKSPHYKIISVWRQKIKEWPVPDKPEYSFDIYSSETNSWSLSKIKFPGDWGIKFSHGVFFKGAVHWYSNCRESHYFDVENECLKTMPMPRVDKVQCQYFGESGGYLNLAIAHSAAKRLKFSVFEMVEDYSDWYLKYSLSLEAEYDTLSRLPFWSSYPYFGHYVLFCAMQSEEGDSLFAVFSEGKAMSYNLKDGTLKGLHCPRVDQYGVDYFCFRACRYIETLFCI